MSLEMRAEEPLALYSNNQGINISLDLAFGVFYGCPCFLVPERTRFAADSLFSFIFHTNTYGTK